MTLPGQLWGRRLDDLDKMECPGDYVVFYARDQPQAIRCLWFIMPEGTQGRIAGKGYGVTPLGGAPEPEWTITEDGDGRVTVSPSIDYPGYWHGHLEGSIWRPA